MMFMKPSPNLIVRIAEVPRLWHPPGTAGFLAWIA